MPPRAGFHLKRAQARAQASHCLTLQADREAGRAPQQFEQPAAITTRGLHMQTQELHTHEMRAEARLPVTQRGKLGVGTDWFPCMVLDMSNSGFLMLSNKQLAVGQTFDFRCEFAPQKVFECKIEIMHSNDDSVGTMITEIDTRSTGLLHSYLEEKYAVKLEDRPRKRLGE